MSQQNKDIAIQLHSEYRRWLASAAQQFIGGDLAQAQDLLLGEIVEEIQARELAAQAAQNVAVAAETESVPVPLGNISDAANAANQAALDAAQAPEKNPAFVPPPSETAENQPAPAEVAPSRIQSGESTLANGSVS